MLSAEAQAMLRDASALFREGRMAEAVPAYRRLLEAAPDLPDSWFNLAMAQRATRDFPGALASYAEALARGVSGPEEVHLQRGVIYSDDLGDPAAARRELDAALAIAPDYVPALLNLGNLHEDLGERAAARSVYARAVELAPGDNLALARLVGVTGIAATDDPLLERIRGALADARTGAPDRADLGFALGAALDRLGDYDAAFAAYSSANAAAAGARFDRAKHSQAIDRLIAAFPEPATGGDAGPAPIFICGMFRSGSTLIETILARHSDVVAGGELAIVPALVRSLQPYPEAAAEASPETIAAFRDRYRAEVAHRNPAGALLTDKRPDNFLHIGLIKRMFPDAKIVQTVRDPRDTALSVYFLHAAPELAYSTDLGDIAHFEREQARLMAHWRALYPGDVHVVDYDRLVFEPEPVIAGLLDFLGLDHEAGLLETRASDGAVRTASVWQVRQPLYSASSGRWRNYRRHLGNLYPDR